MMAGPKLAMSVGGRLANAPKRLIGGKVLGTDFRRATKKEAPAVSWGLFLLL